MSDKLIITSVSNNYSDWVYRVSKLVFSRYSGGLDKWNLPDSDEIWKIHFGKRAAVCGVNLSGRRCCVKLFYDNRAYIRFRNRLGFSKARRAYLKAIELKKRNVLCPEMLGWAVDKKTGLAILITELICEADRVDKFIEKHGSLTEQIIKSLAQFIRNMHDAGVAHSDLSPRNIMIGQRNERFCFWLLDCEDVSFSKKITRRQRLKNLHHLNERVLNTTGVKDRLLFLKFYLDDEIGDWAKDLRDYLQQHPSKYISKEMF